MNDLGRWHPTSITFIVNGKEYKGYEAPMSLLVMSLIYINLHNKNK
jgi:hypothetical protein